MDPLSGVASVIAVIQIAGTIVNICYEYRSGVRHAPKTITRLIDEVDGLRDVLKKLDLILEEERTSGFNSFNISFNEITKKGGLLSQCYLDLQGLRKVLEPKHGMRAVGQALQWPLKEKDVSKTLQQIERFKTLLSLALAGEHT